jgi:carboxyl-terminal processing protease
LRPVRWRVAGISVVLVLLTVFAVALVFAYLVGKAQSPAAIEDAPKEDREALVLYAQALRTVREEYVDRGATDPETITRGAVEGMLDTLGDDGHTRFLTAEEMEETREGLGGEYVGVGVQLEERDDGEVSVLSPLAGSPAERAGVRPGDVVVGIGEWTARGAGVEEVVARIKGPEGTEVVLAVERENGGTIRGRSFDLARETIDAPAASWASVGPQGETALVSLSSFTEDVAADLRSAFGEAESRGATSYVLDLRGNPGGELEEAVAAASLFLDGGQTVYVREDAGGERERIEAADPTPFSGGDEAPVSAPLVVLVDGGSASSSEILAGALKDNGRARVVGQRTAGTGTVLAEFPLEDGSSMLLGVAEWLTPGGDSIRGSGIEPDVPASPGDAGEALAPVQIDAMEGPEALARDPQLAAAVRALEAEGP